MGTEQDRPGGRDGGSLQGLLERLSPRRQVFGLVVAGLGGLVLALPTTEAEPLAWVAFGLTLVLFGLDGWRPVTGVLDHVGDILSAVLAALLIEGTGGGDSVFQDLYVLILVYAAVTLSWSRFLLDALVVLAAATTPAWWSGGSPRFWEDLLVDYVVWMGVALLAALVMQRLQATAADAQRLRSVVDDLKDSVTVVDTTTHEVLYANQGAAEVVGTTPGQMVGRDVTQLTDLVSSEDLTAMADVLRRTKGVHRRQYEMPWGDETRVVEAVTRVIATNDGTEVLAVVGRDITAMQRQHDLEHRLAAIVDASDTAILSTDLRGLVQTWNPAAERLYGWSSDEAIGEPVVRLLAPPADEDEPPPLVVTANHQQFETRHGRRDGSAIDVAVTVSPIRHEDGRVAGVAMLSRDVSASRRHQRELAEREDRFRTLAEQANGIVYRVRLVPDVAVEYVNPRVEEITGHPPERFLEEPELLYRRTPADDQPKVDVARHEHVHDEPGVATYRFERADGTWIWLEDHHRPERDEHGRVVATQGLMFDITSRRESEQARAGALEHQRQAAAALRRTVEIQHTFLQAVSHELRTPLTSVLGFARTLETHLDRLGRDEQHDLIDRLSRNAERLAALLDDLLDLDQVTRGVLELRRVDVDLAALCRQVVDRLDARGHEVRLDLAPVVVPMDRAKIERAVDNLLRNAVKHTPADATVSVRLEERDGHAVLSVEDDGPGVPDAVADTIFEPFQQGPQAASDASPGTGVGLALVREFARLHDGEAWYEPRVPVGARFCIRLPVDNHAVHGDDLHEPPDPEDLHG